MDGTEGFKPALGFHVLTPLYDRVVAMTTRERTFKQALLDQAAIEPHQQVLDVGCGTGTLAIGAQQRQSGVRVSALDADPTVLAIAVRKAHRAGADIAFDQGRSSALPYADEQFDRVLSSLFFHHLSWGDKLLTAREIHRVLRPTGELHVADWGRAGGLASRAAFLMVQLLDGFETTSDNVAGMLPVLFGSAGFRQVEETRRISTALGIVSLYRAVKSGAGPGKRSAGGKA
ncbi:class I SAM-dependent methyltransferase [Rhizobacter sp. J219]|jgi:SAM-dependent methyltransferase|uniref:class I SAM-dependent methyltransferase n=1 Tax=Rhizobacter sp. J219 TaxID=2898430 RepID=UPI002150E170|nr:class I SAM-dependent methyltransferase [Rhizobacter sp. J219]MCR5882229.1 class I SAM-dependent methyltransferase [Rhizobacter sp. J219]